MRIDKFQPRYQVHEYPGRKPWYVVRKYIEKYSKQGETLLEPFCGSGVVPCEALIARRKVIAVDVDPLAIFISKMTCISPVDLAKLEQAFAGVEQAAKGNIYDLYVLKGKCNICRGQLIASSAARTSHGINVRAFCSECGKSYELVCDSEDWESRAVGLVPYWYPADIELPGGTRGNIRYVHELYTDRNLKALSILWHFINLVEDESHRELLEFCFSATLSKASSINVPKVSGKGWTPADYSVYNIPYNFIEFNVWDGFANKFRSCLEAKEQTNQLIGALYAEAKILKASAEDLAFIPDSSADYVLTDPPYADVVRYYERSFVRNSWLGFEMDSLQVEYPVVMRKVLQEISRVLRSGRYLSVLLKGTSQEFREEFVSLAESADLMHESTELEHLGYGDVQNEPADYVFNFANEL